MLKILLNAGHGAGPAHNRGGICFNEGDNNYFYSLVLKEELETYDGVIIDLVRKEWEDNPTVAQRAAMGKGYDLYFSIHSNAADSKVRGTEVFDSVERPNMALAKLVCDATAEFFGHNNRGVKYREGSKPGFNYYGELRFNLAKSAMIVENGFHTNPEDCKIFKNNHKGLAVVQARAIASYYGLKKKEVKENPHWAEVHYENLKNKGIAINEKRFDDKMTRGEVFAMLDRIIDFCKEVE